MSGRSKECAAWSAGFCAFVTGKPSTVPAKWTAWAEWYEEGHAYADFLDTTRSGHGCGGPRLAHVSHEFGSWLDSEAGMLCRKKHDYDT